MPSSCGVQSLEIDIVAPLLGDGILTGAVKWNREPIGPNVHRAHLSMLERAGASVRKWAHDALRADAPILYVAAGGFTPAFHETVEDTDRPIILWTLDDIYRHGPAS